ncbi:MAG: DUF695 domain-containing protein [Woeseiaceae bacterium]|nr:DUF695 domain-containing protein [Woeseiaceae bacterium]
MTGHWEFFPCQMGENVAFVFYDHGIRKSIDALEQDRQVRFDLAYRHPDENGLPSDEEFDVGRDIEDRIDVFAKVNAGAYVGRVTTAGHRYFYCYAGASPDEVRDFVATVSEATGYDLVPRILEDPDKKGYWNDLYPTADDWQMIKDSKVVNALREEGDDDTIPRRIDHWAYFARKSDAEAYAEWLAAEGFGLECLRRTKPLVGDWQLKFFRSDRPELYSINRVTCRLRQKLTELNGDYDGWETSVEKGGA